MQIEELKKEWDTLQKRFGDPALQSIYGAGCLQKPDLCFVFMNPTGKNVSAYPHWQGLRAPWIGTKHVWKLFAELKLIPSDLFSRIQSLGANEWDPSFAHLVYETIADRGIYITNLSKSTQKDARPLPNSVFLEYLPSFHKEMLLVQPKCVIAFGNQVSSILLGRPVSVSQTRKTSLPLCLSEITFPIYPAYYPVGQGMRNMDKAIEDIRWIMKKS